MMIHLHAVILDDVLQLVSEQQERWIVMLPDRHRVALQSEMAHALFSLWFCPDTATPEPYSYYKHLFDNGREGSLS